MRTSYWSSLNTLNQWPPKKINYSQAGQYFLLVLMWPACPQLAHLRVVPVAFSTVGMGVDEGETARSGVGEA